MTLALLFLSLCVSTYINVCMYVCMYVCIMTSCPYAMSSIFLSLCVYTYMYVCTYYDIMPICSSSQGQWRWWWHHIDNCLILDSCETSPYMQLCANDNGYEWHIMPISLPTACGLRIVSLNPTFVGSEWFIVPILLPKAGIVRLVV